MNIIVIDSETDGWAYDCTKIWVLGWTQDGINYETTNDYDVMRGILSDPDAMFACHNAIRFDLVVFNRILGTSLLASQFIDTLALSWYLHYSRQKHGLESYGIDYGVPKPNIDDWQGLSYEQYQHRVIEDVKINWKLWKDLENKLNILYPVESEKIRFIKYLSHKMNCARIQEEQGVPVDTSKAQEYLTDIEQQLAEKHELLKLSLPKVPIYEVKNIPAKPLKKDGTLSTHGINWYAFLASQGLPSSTQTPVRYVRGHDEPNPASGPQIKDWLESLGWVCKTWKYERNKETGEEKMIPQIRYGKGHANEGELTEEILELVSKDPAVELLAGMSVLQHRKGFFEGIVSSAVNGKLVASIEGLTNTLRFKHKKPLANIPSVGKPWGKEIRSCIKAPDGYLFCGSDMVSLEDTTKRHYMLPIDPDYVAEMQKPGFDPHLNLALFAGAVTQQDIDDHVNKIKDISNIRKKYKIVNYSSIYGVGKDKLARETGLSVKEAKKLLEDYWNRNHAVVKISENVEVKSTGQSMWLKNPVSGFWYELRYRKDSFSTLNQSTGVFCFDTWLYYLLQLGVYPCGQWHDEELNLIKEDQQELNTNRLNKAIERTNEQLKLNVPLGIDIKYGSSYASVH